MKIKITSSADVVPSVTEVLGDDSAKAYVSGFLPDSVNATEEVELVRAESATFFDRKNVKTTIPFRVDRVFASYELALKFVIDHLRRVPRRGTVEISQQSNGAFTTWLKDAALSRAKVVQLNATVVFEYEIAGGQLLAANPAASGGAVPGP